MVIDWCAMSTANRILPGEGNWTVSTASQAVLATVQSGEHRKAWCGKSLLGKNRSRLPRAESFRTPGQTACHSGEGASRVTTVRQSALPPLRKAR